MPVSFNRLPPIRDQSRSSLHRALQYFKNNLQRSRYFDEIGVVSFCLRLKIFHLAPRIYPDTVAPIMEILKTMPKPMFVAREISILPISIQSWESFFF